LTLSNASYAMICLMKIEDSVKTATYHSVEIALSNGNSQKIQNVLMNEKHLSYQISNQIYNFYRNELRSSARIATGSVTTLASDLKT